MTKSHHSVFAPVYGLELGPIVNGELHVGRVTFVDAKKMPRIRKRLGLKHPVSFYRDRSEFFLKNADVYAVIKSRREPSDNDVSTELKLIQQSFWLLASSFSYFKWREDAALSLHPTDSTAVHDIAVIDHSSSDWRANFQFMDARKPNRCCAFWKMNAERGHFFSLLKICEGKTSAKPSWMNSLKRAAVLFGQSFLARHVAEAFTYNMIAIETLLCKQGDKFPSSLVDRVNALFGWIYNDDPGPWKDKVARMYQLRCGYIHDGIAGEISGMDLFVSDTMVRNLLANLCNNTDEIKSKSDIIELSEKLRAYKTLGMEPVRSPKFVHEEIANFPKVIEKINNTFKWER